MILITKKEEAQADARESLEDSSKADEAGSDNDLGLELEKGLQEATTSTRQMDTQDNTPANSEDIILRSNPAREMGTAGSQRGVEGTAVHADEQPIQEHIEVALLREINENALTEVQIRRKEKEKQYAALLKTLHDKELDRYEAFRRSNLSRGRMRKLLMSISGQTINDEKILIVVCCLAKMFVGELIEEAREMATMEGYEGPLLRAHIHHAYTLMESEGHVKHKRVLKKLFKHL